MANTLRYEIRDLGGILQAVHIRHELPDGSKRMLWQGPDGTRGLSGRPVASLPLFGSHRLPEWPQDSPVVITEGEKCAQALIDMGIPAVGTVTGASSCPSADALQDLAGRKVALWADHDDAGEKHMVILSEYLESIADDVRYIDPPKGVPEHWDAADAIGEGVDVQALIHAARPRPAAIDATGTTAVDGSPNDDRIDAADLLEQDLPALREVVPGLLPEGTTVLASPPKVGKSCLVYQIATEVAVGGDLFGHRVLPGSALYLALEDGKRRGQDRLRAALNGRTMPRGRLEVWWSAPAIGEGLEEQIGAWLDAHPDAAFVAVDTLGRVRPTRNGKANLYDIDVQDVARMQNIVKDRGVALLLVHHVRKDPSGDFLDAVSGSYGISGSVDTVMVARRKRHERLGTISVTGREVPEAELSVEFDGMLWRAAPQALAGASPERTRVFEAIKDHGPIYPKAIAKRLGLGRTSVQNMVSALQADGAIRRGANGWVPYLPHDSHDSESHQSHGREGKGDSTVVEATDRAILDDALGGAA